VVAPAPVALEADGETSPLATEPGAHAAAAAETEMAPINANTSRRVRTRPISRSSSSGSVGEGVGWISVGVIGRLQFEAV
jgi:hypothetical protein